MLAGIIKKRGLSHTERGTLSFTVGAFDDPASWSVLATFGAGPGVAVLAIGGGIFCADFIILFGRSLLAPQGRIVEREGQRLGASDPHVALPGPVKIAFARDYAIVSY